jgi:hypothetical protein
MLFGVGEIWELTLSYQAFYNHDAIGKLIWDIGLNVNCTQGGKTWF